jgi:hypothetical protein
MPAKKLSRRKRNVLHNRPKSILQRLRKLIDKYQAFTIEVQDFLEQIEDEEDHRAIERAKKRDAGKPGVPWAEAKKRLGLD